MPKVDPNPARSLSAVLEPHRAGASEAAVLAAAGPFRLQFRGPAQAFVHLALEGPLVVELDEGEVAQPIPPGGCAVVLGARRHSIADAPGRPPRPMRGFEALERRDEVPVLRFGEGPPTTRVLTSVRPFEGALQTLLRGLPELLTAGCGGDGARAAPFLAAEAVEPLLAGRGSAVFAAALADLCFVQAVRGAFLAVKVPRGTSGSIYRHPQVSAAVNRMSAAPGEDWTVARLAASVGMSRSAFAAAFRAHVGKPPAEFLADVRMDRALAMLGDRRILVSQVARRLGYRSPSAFIRAFRKRQGEPPGRYLAGR